MARSAIVHLICAISDLGLGANDVGVVRELGEVTSEVFFLRNKQASRVENSKFLHIDPLKYGDKHDEKICNVCHRILPTTTFDLNQTGRDNRPVRRPSCKGCRKKIDGTPMVGSEKRRWEAAKPKMTDFECPICRKTTISGLTSKIVLNHNHTNGKILGWLCDSCNTGLGRFRDDPEVLREAIRYLESH